jgi:adenine specific DNA methylase Mod
MPQIVKSTYEKIPTIYLDNKRGSNDLNILNMEGIMDFPKSVEFLKTFISFIKTDNEIICDFFSGSSSTAHAVMKLNSEDNGQRKFIMIELMRKVIRLSLGMKLSLILEKREFEEQVKRLKRITQ